MRYYLLMLGPLLFESENKMVAKVPQGFEGYDSNQAV